MKIDDDSFKKPGAIPFKWEIRPGVPKHQSPQPRADNPNTHVKPESPKLQHMSNQPPRRRVTSSPKLKPPPSGLSCSSTTTIVLNPKENISIRASPRTRSLRTMNLMRQPDVVSSSCFPSPSSVKRRGERTKRINNNDYYSDSDGDLRHHQQQRWSVSSRKSAVSASSPLSSSFASYRSSPRLVNDDDGVDADEWVNAVLMHF